MAFPEKLLISLNVCALAAGGCHFGSGAVGKSHGRDFWHVDGADGVQFVRQRLCRVRVQRSRQTVFWFPDLPEADPRCEPGMVPSKATLKTYATVKTGSLRRA